MLSQSRRTEAEGLLVATYPNPASFTLQDVSEWQIQPLLLVATHIAYYGDNGDVLLVKRCVHESRITSLMLMHASMLICSDIR